MDINVAVKSLAKKRLKIQKISLPNLQNPCTLAHFLEAMVTQQVQAFNARIAQKNTANSHKENTNKSTTERPLEDNYLDILLNTGKVSFGDTYNNTPANITDAVANALQSFADGIFAVFIDDKQIESLDTEIVFKEDTQVSFIRLTFLTGSFW